MSTLPQDHSASSQRVRILARLRQGPLTTVEARRGLDVMHPAMRILELRRRGHAIYTEMTRQETAPGRWHVAGKYVLMKEAQDVVPT